MKDHEIPFKWCFVSPYRSKKKKVKSCKKKKKYIYIYILIAQHLEIFAKCWSSTWLWSNDVEMVEMRCHSKDIDINHQFCGFDI